MNEPRLTEHADEQWPDCVEIGPAPPSGVRFEGETEPAESAANVGRVGAHVAPDTAAPAFGFAA